MASTALAGMSHPPEREPRGPQCSHLSAHALPQIARFMDAPTARLTPRITRGGAQQLPSRQTHSREDRVVKIVAHKRSAKIGSSKIQQVTEDAPTVNRGPATHHGSHEFRWVETNSGGTALCTCRRWELYGTRPNALTKESAQRSHALHRSMVADRAVGRDGGVCHSSPPTDHLAGQLSTNKGGSEE